MPWIGLGMNVAYRPCCWAIALSVNLKVIALSAVWSASAYSKSISCWPAATSWWAASTRMPNASSASTMSCRIDGREVGAEVEVAGLVVGQRLDRPVVGAAEQEELELRAHVDDVAELLGPLDLAPEHEARVAGERLAARRVDVADDAGPPCRSDHGISEKVRMSGMRYWSLSAIRVKPSTDEPSNQVPWRTEPSSWWIGIVTALTTPMMSVNWSWMNRMPLAFAPSISLHARHRFVGSDHRRCLLSCQSDLCRPRVLCSAHEH